MRAYQVFADMKPEQAATLFERISEEAPGVYAQAMALAGASLKARPQFILKQSPAKRADTIRRVLCRVRANDMAEEVLATYFIDCRKELLIEWLDLVGVEHDEGVLASELPAPPASERLREALSKFRTAGTEEDAADRELLLQAFAAQRMVEWPELDDDLAQKSSGA